MTRRPSRRSELRHGDASHCGPGLARTARSPPDRLGPGPLRPRRLGTQSRGDTLSKTAFGSPELGENGGLVSDGGFSRHQGPWCSSPWWQRAPGPITAVTEAGGEEPGKGRDGSKMWERPRRHGSVSVTQPRRANVPTIWSHDDIINGRSTRSTKPHNPPPKSEARAQGRQGDVWASRQQTSLGCEPGSRGHRAGPLDRTGRGLAQAGTAPERHGEPDSRWGPIGATAPHSGEPPGHLRPECELRQHPGQPPRRHHPRPAQAPQLATPERGAPRGRSPSTSR